jgi:Domain of unknown function (DUF4214)
MDTLTGSNDYPSNKKSAISQSEILQSNNLPKTLDGKAFADFLQGSSYNLSPEQFALVSNLDPMEVSDRDFLQSAQQFSHADFVRAIYKAYLNREPGNSELNFWVTEIKIKKGSRIALPIAIRKTVEFTLLSQAIKNKKIFSAPNNFVVKHLFSALKILRKYLGIQSLEIIISINQVIEQNEFIMAGFMDKPKTGDKIKTSTYMITGWLIWKNTPPTIRLISNETVINEVPIEVRRPDVTNAYCLESKTHNWGFKILLNIKDLSERGQLQLQANFANHQVVNFGLIKYIKY